jgi:hypothetical protein
MIISSSTEYASPSPYLETETDPVSEKLFSSFLEFRMIDKVQKPTDSEHYVDHPEF